MNDYKEIGEKIGELVQEKNKKYGDAINAVGDVLEIMYPDGVMPDQYKDFGMVVRTLDKLFRISKGDQGEESAWVDIAGYGILGSKKERQID